MVSPIQSGRSLVVTASDDKTARVWDAATGKPVSEPMKHENIVTSAQFSPDGRWVVTASDDNTARVWDAATGKPVSEPMMHEDIVSSAQFSPDGRWVVTASWDKTSRVGIVPNGWQSVAEAVARTGETFAQLRLNDLGGMDALSADEFVRLRDWMETKTLSAEARQFMEWVLAPSATRRPTPFSEATPE